MIFREGSLGAVAGYDGRAQAFGQPDYVVRAAGGVDFLAEEDYGTFGVAEEVPGALDLHRVALGYVRFAGLQDFDLGLLAEEVGGHFQLDGTRATLAEADESLDEVVGDGFNLADAGVPVGYGGEHTQLVFGFMGGHFAAADELGFHVGGHLEDGGGGEVGFAHGAYGVGSAGAGAGEQDAGFAGGAGVAVGHVAAAQLQASADKAHVVLVVEQGVKEVQGVYGDDAEDGINALGLKRCDNGLAAGHLRHGGTPLVQDWLGGGSLKGRPSVSAAYRRRSHSAHWRLASAMPCSMPCSKPSSRPLALCRSMAGLVRALVRNW